MTDLEMTKLCAEAMGLKSRPTKHNDQDVLPMHDGYDPLHDDAQAMALVKEFNLRIGWFPEPGVAGNWGAYTYNADLNRAIVECVAKMQKEKK
jgi:hypothetical protein